MADPREMDFFEHLDELRSRIIRCLVYVTLGMCVAWFFKSEIMDAIQAPLTHAIARAKLPAELKPETFSPSLMGGFSYAIQLALVGGLLLSFPLMAMEAWLFIEPALYAHEKKYVYIVLPSSIVLFAGGVTLCYVMTPVVFGFLLSFFQILNMKPMLDISKYIWLLVRLLLSFGLIFQLPLVITFLARVGLVSHTTLLNKWRHAVIIILVASAFITPTPDPVNMSLLAGPVMGLYALSILLAKIFGRPREADDPEPEPAAPLPQLEASTPAGDADRETPEDPPTSPADDSASEEPEERML